MRGERPFSSVFWISKGRKRKKIRSCCGTAGKRAGPNGRLDHFGQNDLFPNWILTFARPKSILVHLGPPTVLLGRRKMR